MNAKILYDVYAVNKEMGFPDLTMGVGEYMARNGVIPDDERKKMQEFIGRHGQELASAFPDFDAFEAAVEAGVKADEESNQEAEIK